MQRLKRSAPLLVSLALVVAVGIVSFVASVGSSRQANTVHADDRVVLQKTLADLAGQYMLFVAADANAAATSGEWALTPGHAGDIARLRDLVDRSMLFDYGASLVTLTGEPLSGWASEPGLPPAGHPGFAPIARGLLAGEPGLSSVIEVGGVSVVGVAVPIMDGALPRAVLVAFFRIDTAPLQTYSKLLTEGMGGTNYTVDSEGTVVASSEPGMLGRRLPASPALAALAKGEGGFDEYDSGGRRVVASYDPIGVGGWSTITEQDAAEFYGPISSSGTRTSLAILALLVVAAVTVAAFGAKRQAALRAAYDYKGELLANTTHELKTPLTAIRGSAVTLGMHWRDLPPQDVDALLGMIHRRTDGLKTLIDRILMGASLEAGHEIFVEPEPVEVGGILRRIAVEYADASPRHTFVVDAPPEAWVSADPEALDHIAGLLAENAVKYSPDGGEIVLSASVADDMLTVRISDSGIGIDPRDRERIFEPYFRSAGARGRQFGGVGLGLSIVRHLVRRHGGDVSVESEPGRGSTFSFTLPRTAAPAAPAEPAVAVEQ